MCAAILLRTWWIFVFIAVAALYANKKRWPFGLIAPAVNGLIKLVLVVLIANPSTLACVAIWALFTVRNVLGDVRDAEKDSREGVITLPVFLGYRKRTPFVYPTALALTTIVWVVFGALPMWLIPAAWVVEASTYHLTPR